MSGNRTWSILNLGSLPLIWRITPMSGRWEYPRITPEMKKGRFRNYRVFLARLATEVGHPWLLISVYHLSRCPSLSAPDPKAFDAMQICDCDPTPVIEIVGLEEPVGETNVL